MDANRLEPLQRIAGDAVQTAAARMAETATLLEAAENKLVVLQDYANDYENDMVDSEPNVRLLQNKREFLNRLILAVDEQTAQVARLKEEYEARQNLCMVARHRDQVLKQVGDKHRQEQLVLAARQQQKEQDEHASTRNVGRFSALGA